MKKSIFLTSLMLLSTSVAFATENCQKTRAALDLGSSTFKLKVAKVDICLQKIVTVLFTDSVKTSFKDSVVDGKLSEAAFKRGREVIQSFLDKSKELGATEFFGVGTQIFRELKQPELFLNSFSPEFAPKAITQQEEAHLGYVAALANLDSNDQSIAVWDIGGGSMQITAIDKRRNFVHYRGKLASLAARDLAKKHQQESALLSPNPIGAENAKVTIDEIRTLAKHEFLQSSETKKLSRLVSKLTIIGIGGVHNQSVLNQLQTLGLGSKRTFQNTDLAKAIDIQSVKTDAEIGGKYADTEVSNLILVLGFMRALGIHQVQAVDANLADGLLAAGYAMLK